MPQSFVQVEALPIRVGGKVDLQALPPPGPAQGTEKPKATSGPAGGATVELLALIAAELLPEPKEAQAELLKGADFFSHGLTSLLAGRLASRVAEHFGQTVGVLDIMAHPTPQALASFLVVRHGSVQAPSLVAPPVRPVPGAEPLALVTGIAGKFPGAADVPSLWQNLLRGHDSLRHLELADLRVRGVPANVLARPDYVPVAQVVDGAFLFDADFFRMSPAEASMLDPQHRLLLECAWAAAEASGTAPRSGTPVHSGVAAASGIDGYHTHHVRYSHPWLDPGRQFLAEISSEKDYAAARIAWGLDLGGPATVVQAACASGLLAVATAVPWVALEGYPFAFAGAASLTFPNLGYLYIEGLVGSRDGRVRPFDASASGTLFGDGVACVCVEAHADSTAAARAIATAGAVVRGWGISSDGARAKGAFSAPSAVGQADAITQALRRAKVSGGPNMLDFVEAHATATLLGDAIEARGLALACATLGGGALRTSTPIGSIKGNIGHANAAAGITGFVKAVKTMMGSFPQTCHLEATNPHVVDNLRGTGLHVIRSTSPIPRNDHSVALQGGVSSFGIGGTNVHAVLESVESSPPTSASMPSESHGTPEVVLAVSARSEAALASTCAGLADWLASDAADEILLVDIARTLALGRESFASRYAIVAESRDGAIEQLRDVSGTRVVTEEGTYALAFCGQDAKPGALESMEVQLAHFDSLNGAGAPPVAIAASGAGVLAAAAAANFVPREAARAAATAIASSRLDEAAEILATSAKSLDASSSKLVPVAVEHPNAWLMPRDVSDIEFWRLALGVSTGALTSARALLARWNPVVVLCAASLVDIADDDAKLQRTVPAALACLWQMGAAPLSAMAPPLVGRRREVPGYAFERKLYAVRPWASVHGDPRTPSDSETPFPFPDTSARIASTESLFVRVGEHEAMASTTVLYCFPFAGGSAASFVRASRVVPSDVSVVCVELPARGRRATEDYPMSNDDDMRSIAQIAAAIAADARGRSIVMLGLSYGGLVAVEVASLLDSHHGTSVDAVVVAGRAPPLKSAAKSVALAEEGAQAPAPCVEEKGEEAYNLAPEALRGSADWDAVFLPRLQRDLEADDRAAVRLTRRVSLRATCALHILCGEEDDVAPLEGANEWAAHREGNAPVESVQTFPGTHGFLVEELEAIFMTTSGLIAELGTLSLPVKALGWDAAGELPLKRRNGAAAEQDVRTLTPDAVDAIDAAALVEGDCRRIVLDLAGAVKATPPLGEGGGMHGASSWLNDELTRTSALVAALQRLIGWGAKGEVVLALPASAEGGGAAAASRVVPLECPGLHVRRVFLDGGSAFDASDACDVVGPSEADILLRCRGRRRRVLVLRLRTRLDDGRLLSGKSPRKRRAVDDPNPLPALLAEVPEDEVVIVTGGTGALGKAVVAWLLGPCGIRPGGVHVLARRVPAEADRLPGARYAAVDLANPHAIAASVELRALHGVAAIFHLAGALRDGVFERVTSEDLAAVAAPKARAFLHLLAYADEREWAPRFACVFSSTSSVLGARGQASYAAANGILDHVAWFSSTATPVLAVHWGSWGEAGMAARGSKAFDHALAAGERPLRTAEGLQCLAAALDDFAGEPWAPMAVVACDVRWASSPWKRTGVVKALVEDDALPKTTDAEAPAAGATEDLVTRVAATLEPLAAAWDLHTTSTLDQLGVDSLDAVTMRNAVNAGFDAALPLSAFDLASTPSALVSRVVAALGEAAGGGSDC